MSPPRRIAATLCLSGLVAACPADPGAGGPAASADRDTPPEVAARRAVAEALGTAPDAVTVISVEPREFADASLGCPQPGMAYAQVLTPGWQVVVEAEGRRFDVRVNQAGAARLCRGRKGAGPAAFPQDEAAASRARAAGQARQALAAWLDAGPDTLRVLSTAPRPPGTALAGCPDCPDGADCGTLVTLFAAGRQYRLLVRGDTVTACPPFAAD